MSSIASFAIRRTASSVSSVSSATKTSQQVPQLAQLAQLQRLCLHARYLTVGKSVPIDVDHYVSGWDNKNGSSPLMSPTGKYQIQTFNKISPKVCV